MENTNKQTKRTIEAEVNINGLSKYFEVETSEMDTEYKLYVKIVEDLTFELYMMGKDHLLSGRE